MSPRRAELADAENWRPPALRDRLRRADPTAYLRGEADYASAAGFFDSFRERIRQRLFPTLPAGWDIHHRVELQVLRSYPGAFRPEELNARRNFLPVPAGFHRAWIRRFWNRRYELLDRVIEQRGLTPSAPGYREFVRGRILAWAPVVDGAVRRHLAGRPIPVAVAPMKRAALPRDSWVARYRSARVSPGPPAGTSAGGGRRQRPAQRPSAARRPSRRRRV